MKEEAKAFENGQLGGFLRVGGHRGWLLRGGEVSVRALESRKEVHELWEREEREVGEREEARSERRGGDAPGVVCREW